MAPQGKCPSCGQLIGSSPGQPAPIHTLPDNHNAQCPGGITKPL